MKINLAGAFAKPARMSRADCQRHYVENHGPLIRDTTDFSRDVTRYTQHARIWSPGIDTADDDICGVSQLLYRDLDAIRTCFAGPGYTDVIRHDEHRFADLNRALVVIGPVETPLAGGEDAPTRLFRFIPAGSGGDRQAYGEAVALSLFGTIAGFSQTFSLDGEHNPFSAAPLFDGMDEFRFDDIGSIAAFLAEEKTLPGSPSTAITLVGGYRLFIYGKPRPPATPTQHGAP